MVLPSTARGHVWLCKFSAARPPAACPEARGAWAAHTAKALTRIRKRFIAMPAQGAKCGTHRVALVEDGPDRLSGLLISITQLLLMADERTVTTHPTKEGEIFVFAPLSPR